MKIVSGSQRAQNDERLGKGGNMSDNYKEFKDKAKTDESFCYFCINLYEKGVISSETLLDIIGFDSAEEHKRFKEEDTVKLNPSRTKTPKSYGDDHYIELQRIEQARRNIESTARISNIFLEDEEILATIKETIKTNVAIMNEVENLK